MNEVNGTFRASGAWTIKIGRGNFLDFFMPPADGPEERELQRRLSVLAACASSFLMSALDNAGVIQHGIRVSLHHPGDPRISVWTGRPRISGRMLVDTPAELNQVQALYRGHVLSDERFLLMARPFASVDIVLSVQSSHAIRIP